MRVKRLLFLSGAAVAIAALVVGVLLLRQYAAIDAASDAAPIRRKPLAKSVATLLTERFPNAEQELESSLLLAHSFELETAKLSALAVPGVRQQVRDRRTAFLKRLLNYDAVLEKSGQHRPELTAAYDLWLTYFGTWNEYNTSWYRSRIDSIIDAWKEDAKPNMLVSVVELQRQRIDQGGANSTDIPSTEAVATASSLENPYLALMHAREEVLIHKHSKRLDEFEVALQSAVVDFLAREADAVDDFQFLWEVTSDVHEILSPKRKRSLLMAVVNDSAISDWLVHMLAGQFHRDLAWKSRGGGYASSVTRHGWQDFTDSMQIARRHFRIAWAQRPEIPYAPQKMIMVSKAFEDDFSPRLWFKLAVTAQFDLHASYSTYLHTLRPRWGGSIDRMLDLGYDCAATKDFSSEVANHLYMVLAAVSEEVELNAPDDFDAEMVKLFSLPDLQSALRAHWDAHKSAVAADAGIRPARTENALSWKAACAFRMDDKEAIVSALEELGDSNAVEGFERLFSRGDVAKAKAHAVVSVPGGAIRKLDEKIRLSLAADAPTETIAATLEQLAELRSQLDESSELFLLSREVQLKRLLMFKQGEWVPLEFSDHMLGWSVKGKLTLEDKSTVTVARYQGPSPPFVECRTSFPVPYEVVATVERIRQEPLMDAIGIDLGTESTPTSVGGCFVCAKSNPLGGGVCSRYPEFRDSYQVPGTDDHTEIKIRVWADFYEALWDGGTLPIPVHRGFRPGKYLSFGGSRILDEHGAVRVSNIRIHKIPERPRDLGVHSPETTIPYLKTLMEIDPDDGSLKLRLAEVYAKQFRWGAANELLNDLKVEGDYPWQAGPAVAEVALGMGACSRAKELYQELLEAEPENELYRNALAWILAAAPDEEDRDAETALGMAQALVKERPQHWRYHLTLAAAFAESGDAEGAQRALAVSNSHADPPDQTLVTLLEEELSEHGRLRHKPTPDADGVKEASDAKEAD